MAKKTEQTVEQKRQDALSKLSKGTRNRIASTIANLPQMSGTDRTFAIASTFASILNDAGVLKETLGRDKFLDAIGTFDLAANWDKLNNFERFVSAGKQIVNVSNNFGDTEIPFAGDALGLAGIGYAQYNLMNNWDQLDSVQRLVGLAHTFTNIGNAYNVFNNINNTAQVLSQGTSTIASNTALNVANATSGTGGVVAGEAANVAFNAGGTTAATAAQGGEIAATEAANIAFNAEATAATQAAGTVGSEALASIIDVSGWVAAAYGAFTLVDSFGEGSARNRVSGAVAGAAIGTKIYPGVGTAIGAVLGTGIGSIKSGKSKEQESRDSYRDYFKEIGVLDQFKDLDPSEIPQGFDTSSFKGDSHILRLSDGTFYNVGLDGSDSRALFQGQAKTFSDSSKILTRDKETGFVRDNGELNPYDVDYTNDLDFFSSHALTALQYIVGGGAEQGEKSTEFGQTFGQLANGATSNASSRDFTQDNFNSTMANVRQIYANLGINNSDQAYNILQQLNTEGKITDEQFQIAGQGLRTSFNNDFEYAQELNSTRFDDLETVGGRSDFVSQGETLPERVEPVPGVATGGASTIGDVQIPPRQVGTDVSPQTPGVVNLPISDSLSRPEILPLQEDSNDAQDISVTGVTPTQIAGESIVQDQGANP